MRTFCIIYKVEGGDTAEYYVNAESKAEARKQFRTDFLRGEIDYPSDGTIVSIVEENR